MKFLAIIISLILFGCNVKQENLRGLYRSENDFLVDSLWLKSNNEYSRVLYSKELRKIVYTKEADFIFDEQEQILRLRNFYQVYNHGYELKRDIKEIIHNEMNLRLEVSKCINTVSIKPNNEVNYLKQN